MGRTASPCASQPILSACSEGIEMLRNGGTIGEAVESALAMHSIESTIVPAPDLVEDWPGLFARASFADE